MEASSSSRPAHQGGPPATPSHPSLLPALSPSKTLEQTPAPLHNLPPHLQQGLTPHSRPGSAQPQHTLQQQHPGQHSHNQPPIPQPQFILPPGHIMQNGGAGMVGQGSNVFGVVMGNAPGQGPADNNIPTNTKVYASVYSGIPVFEAMIRGISVMRRSSDSWVNATQILKVAGIPKSQRTKILEKEILTGLHEKVQGGYGKYQGTWIPLPRGKDLAAQYGVTAFLSPIFDFVPSPNNVAALPLSRDTPDRAGTKTPGQSMMSHYNPMMSGGRVHSPYPQHTLQPHPHAPPQFSNGEGMMMPPHPSNMAYPPNMYYPPQQYAQDNGASVGMAMTPSRSGGGIGGPLAPAPDINGMGLPQSHSDVYIDQYGQPHPTYQGQHFIANGNGHEDMQPPPAKRQRSNEGLDFANGDHTMDQDPQLELEPTQQDPTQEEADDDTDSLDDETKDGPPLPAAMRLANKPIRPKGNAQTSRTRSKLLSLFSTDEAMDLRALFGLAADADPAEIDIDMVIDNQGHTALHWACALAKLPTITQLIELGADIHRGNYAGETALIRSVLTTNHFESGTFGQLLVHLAPSIRTLDHSHRTAIHHIALIAGVKGRAASARSYMTTVLEWVAKEQTGQDATGGMSLKNLVDVQDLHGDSALNVAARVGNKSLIKLLLDAGADKARANNLGLKPADFGVEVEALKVSPAEAVVSNLKSEVPKPERRSRDVQKNISAIFETINDTFAAEMTQKQTKLNATEASVRHATRALSDKRQQVQRAQAALGELEQIKQKIENVKRALGSLPIQDWSGRSPLSKEITGESPVAPSFQSIQVEPASTSTATGDEIRLPERGEEGALVRLRRIALWEDRIATTLEDRMRALEGESADKAVKYRKLVSLCTKVPADQVDGSLDVLTQAIESDGTSLDLSRISGFLSRMKDAQPQGLAGGAAVGQAQVA